jgi:hypothetical protein
MDQKNGFGLGKNERNIGGGLSRLLILEGKLNHYDGFDSAVTRLCTMRQNSFDSF